MKSVLRLILTGIFLCTFLTSAYAHLDSNKTEVKTLNGYKPIWWKEAIVYQVYPRSFKDSNGDGIGDLKGILSKLDYLQNLGVDVIWLSPHYDSPNIDNGYDIRDYRKIMAEFGTMEDFDALLAAMKARHMKLIIDLVVNHTSDQHKWFLESKKSKDNPYRNYYIWRAGQNGKPPNNFHSFFSESAWKFDPTTNEYYLHYFTSQQPDLNWDNPKVRAEIYRMMKFWLDKGIAGFRMDVIPFISKNQNFPDLTEKELNSPQFVFATGPHLHDYLKEMNRKVLAKYNVMTVGEAYGVTLEQTPLLVDERRHELNMIFNFAVIELYRDGPKKRQWTLPELKAIYSQQDQKLDVHSWNTLFISNHDNPRPVSNFGDDSSPYRNPSAKLLATMLLTLKGTPFIYQGDELGMTNYPFKNIADFKDVWAQKGWETKVLKGKISREDYIANLRNTSRDNSRTPMQWDDLQNAGFTTAEKPWMAINPNYKEINAKQEVNDANSVYHYFRQLIRLRKNTPALIYGNYRDLDPTHKKIYAYTRTLNNESYLIVLNFSRDHITYLLPQEIKAGQLVITNIKTREANKALLHLQAWEARIYKQY